MIKVFIKTYYLLQSQIVHKNRMMSIGKRNVKAYVQVKNFSHATFS